MHLNAGDRVQIMISVSHAGRGLGLEAIRPAGEPLVPGIIATFFKIGD